MYTGYFVVRRRLLGLLHLHGAEGVEMSFDYALFLIGGYAVLAHHVCYGAFCVVGLVAMVANGLRK